MRVTVKTKLPAVLLGKITLVELAAGVTTVGTFPLTVLADHAKVKPGELPKLLEKEYVLGQPLA